MKSLATAAVLPLASAALINAQEPGHPVAPTAFVAGNVAAGDMGRCLLKRDRREAVAVVDLDPATPAFRSLAKAIERPMIACLKGKRSATISPFYLRGAIAEALLREDDDAMLRTVGSMAPVAAVRVSALADADAAPAVIRCAAKADPADAAAMILADASTPAEMEAFRKLAPSLQACAPAAGEVKLRQPTVRPGVAIALYRLGRVNTVSPSSNGAN